jgi:hypothetical protein
MPRYFNLTLIAPLTRSQRVVAMRVGQKFFLRQAERFLQGNAEAKLDFNEFGIPPKQQAAFARWVIAQGQMTPLTFAQENDATFKHLYSLAMVRFVDLSIQNPGIDTRPMGAFSGYGRAIFSIMGFAMSFQRNVMVRSAKRFSAIAETTRGQSKLTRAQAQLVWAAPRLLSAGLLIAFSLMARMLRDLWDDPAGARLERRVQRMRDDPAGAIADVIANAGFTGGFDPLYQVLRNWRYEKDLGLTVVGAVPGFYLQNIQNMIQGATDSLGDKTPTSNWAERRAWESLYLMTSGLGATLALTGAGMTGPLGFLTLSALTSRTTGHWLSEQMAPFTPEELDRAERKVNARAAERELRALGMWEDVQAEREAKRQRRREKLEREQDGR